MGTNPSGDELLVCSPPSTCKFAAVWVISMCMLHVEPAICTQEWPMYVSPDLISNTPSQIARCHHLLKVSWRILLMHVDRTYVSMTW